MAKPSGPSCNLNCSYCFYTEKTALFGEGVEPRMSDAVLEAYVSKYISSQDTPEVTFAWQGGEPTLMGIDFFKKVLDLQNRHSQGKTITNSIQTNGIMLSEKWCGFLAEHNFLVGLSLDGPREINDVHRVNRAGKPTFRSVLEALRRLRKHGVEFNILSCVTRESAKKPMDVYHFLTNEGVQFVQFIPVVERMPNARADELGLKLALPPGPWQPDAPVTGWSVDPEGWGDFLTAIFDEWVRHDVGRVFVMNFEWTVAGWAGIRHTVCAHSQRCGDCLVLEHNGDIYACDHYVYPEYKRGNILTDDLSRIVWSKQQSLFGAAKETGLTAQCRECAVLWVCRGDCLKHRFAVSKMGETGHSYLCEGYLNFFTHSRPYMMKMLDLISSGLPADHIMRLADDPMAIYR